MDAPSSHQENGTSQNGNGNPASAAAAVIADPTLGDEVDESEEQQQVQLPPHACR